MVRMPDVPLVHRAFISALRESVNGHLWPISSHPISQQHDEKGYEYAIDCEVGPTTIHSILHVYDTYLVVRGSHIVRAGQVVGHIDSATRVEFADPDSLVLAARLLTRT